MPDHAHLFVCGHEEFLLGRWIGSLKRALARGCGWPDSGQKIWQEGFFDHVLRNDESMSEKWEYIRQNPVRARLVNDPEDWPYQGEIVPIDRV
jgi:REP element-mobilizing transposase RayT